MSFDLFDEPSPNPPSSPDNATVDSPGLSADVAWPDLNAAQRRAVTASLDPQLVVAGPGTGKTRVLVARAAFLLTRHAERISPSDLAVITFTRKAARQLTARLAEIVGPKAQHVRAGTIHQFCAQILQEHGDAVGVSNDLLIAPEAVTDAYWQRWFEANEGWARSNDMNSFRAAKMKVSRAKLGIETVTGRLQSAIRAYDDMLADRGALDFDDLLVKARDAVNIPAVRDTLRSETRAILVDEFQDTDPVQFHVIRQIATVEHGREGVHLFCVADDDQSIYQFRGARPKNLHDLIETFGCSRKDGTLHILSTNYRSNRAIYAVAESVLPRAERLKRRGEITTANEDASPVELISYEKPEDEQAAALDRVKRWIDEGVSHRDIAVLCPWNDHVSTLEERFLRAGIACEASSTDPILNTPAMQRLQSVFALVERIVTEGQMPDGPMQDVLNVILPQELSAGVANVSQRTGASVWGTYQRLARDRAAAEQEGMGGEWETFEETYAALVNVIQQAQAPGASVGDLAEETLRQFGGKTDLLGEAVNVLADPLDAAGVAEGAAVLREWRARRESGSMSGRILVFDRNYRHARILRAMIRHGMGLTGAPDRVLKRSPAAFVASDEEQPRPLDAGDVVCTAQPDEFLRWAEQHDALGDAMPHVLDIGGETTGQERLALSGLTASDRTPVAPEEYRSAGLRLLALLQATAAPAEPEPAFPDYVMIDLETTSLNVDHCRVAEVGAIRVKDGVEVQALDLQLQLPDDLSEEEKETLRTVCGMDLDADFEDAVPVEEAWEKVAAFCRGVPIVAHNGRQCDFRILNRLHRTYGNGTPEPWTTTYDTLPVATRLCPDLPRHTAEALREALLDDSRETAHRALADCRDQQAILSALQARRAKHQRMTVLESLLPLVLAATLTELQVRAAWDTEASWTEGDRHLLETGYRWALRDASRAGRDLRDILPRALPELVRAEPAIYEAFDESRLLEDDTSRQPGVTGRLDALLQPYRDLPVQDGLTGMLSHLALWGHQEAERGESVVTLSTYHSAKGLEFERVICMRVNSNHFPPFYAETAEERAEQRRLLYVGMTRAERHLVVTYFTEGRYNTLSRSPFLRNVPPDAVVERKG